MPAWFDIYGLALDSQQDKDGIQQVSGKLQSLIEAEIARGIPSNKIILVGYSQGGALAIHTALRYPKKLGGAMLLSSYLPVAESVDKERVAVNQSLPIFIAHGINDESLPLLAGKMTEQYLQHLGYTVEFKTYPMGHEVCADEIEDIKKWLVTQLD